MPTTNNSTLSSIFFIISLIPLAFSLSFNISKIGPDTGRSIPVQGSAYITPQGIQVTPNERDTDRGLQAGRATYFEPLHLWDKASRNLTDFETHFSFVIDSSGRSPYADGLAFFLAPKGSTIQPWSYGGSLGIGNGSGPLNSSSYFFVAVEFDTFKNGFDPNTSLPHVGIDVNSMRSVNTTTWMNNITDGRENDAWISYSASSMMLSVEFTGFWENKTWRDSLSYEVDLREYLPEYVTFGFSAATGSFFERHNVKSWQFSSSLEVNIGPGPGPEPGTLIPEGKKNSRGLKIVED